MDTNIHKYEIVYTEDTVAFLQDEMLLFNAKVTNVLFAENMHLKFRAESVNSGGINSNNGLYVSTFGFNRLNSPEMRRHSININATGTTVVRRGPGRLISMVVQKDSGALVTRTVTVYDNTAGSGTVITSWSENTDSDGLLYKLGVDFNNGLTVVIAQGTGPVTLVWE